MAIVNAKNGIMVAQAAFALGGMINEAFNQYRARSTKQGLTQELSPELVELKSKLDAVNAEMQTRLSIAQAGIDKMSAELAAAHRSKKMWSIASFALGLIPFAGKMLGLI